MFAVTGGWTLLAGLYKQCGQAAIEGVNLLTQCSGHADHREHIRDLRRGADRFMPVSHRYAVDRA